MPHRSQTGTPRARGFAAMDANKQREIASMGGRAAHRSGNAHEFDAEEAREAGRRGGLARSASRRASRSIELADGQGVMMPGTGEQARADTMSRSSESMERPSDTGTLPH
jgi:general stress protein YciG